MSRDNNFYAEKRVDPLTSVSLNQGIAKYSMFLKCVEIHEGKVFDLLYDTSDLYDDPTIQNAKNPLCVEMTHDQKHYYCLNIDQLTAKEIEIDSFHEACYLLKRAHANRFIFDHQSQESISQFVIIVKLVKIEGNTHIYENLKENQENQHERVVSQVSQLCFADVTGFDHLNNQSLTMNELNEKNYINQSLMALRECIDVINENAKNPFHKRVLLLIEI